ncbi:MAG: hypothetical protein IPK12_06100 [Gemmatimonadetes bacterium]|nr:hypothetical protein [Gemmatimonadota bacterium]
MPACTSSSPQGRSDRHGLHVAAIPGEPAVLHQAPVGEGAQRAAVRHLVECHRQLQLGGIHAERGAGDGHALGIPRQLELGRRGPELLEDQLAVGEDVHLAVGHAAVHPPRHLQDLVGAKVQAVQDVAALVHHVGVARIVDHHGVEPAHVERRLPRRRHGQQEGVRHLPLEERADHADRLAPVVEGGVEPRPAAAQPLGQVLHLGARRHEDGDAALLLHHVAHEAVVEELIGLLRDHLHLGAERGIERARLQHTRRLQVPRVERGIHRGRQPDEAAAGALAERQAQLQLGRGLVDLVDDDGVTAGDEVVLEPASGDAGGDDDDVPGGGLGRGLALAVHHPHPERRPQDGLGDGADTEGLAGAGAGHDAEAPAGARQVPELRPVRPLQDGLHRGEPERQLDGLARGPRRGDDHHPAVRVLRAAVRLEIGREQVIAGRLHALM